MRRAVRVIDRFHGSPSLTNIRKDQKVPSQCCKETWAKIPEDEPVFILRGKDLLTVKRVAAWIQEAAEVGVNQDKVQSARLHLEEIRKFQKEHPTRCKLPD